MTRRPTILIVEDDELAQEGLCAVLGREGYTPVVAGTGRRAVDNLHRNTPDLILLDMMMPEMDGWMFLGHFRHTPAWAGIPVVIMTGMGSASDEWAVSMGACELLRKPIEVADLLAAVRRCLARGKS
jgi:CheY-like chemotaxis protein